MMWQTPKCDKLRQNMLRENTREVKQWGVCVLFCQGFTRPWIYVSNPNCYELDYYSIPRTHTEHWCFTADLARFDELYIV